MQDFPSNSQKVRTPRPEVEPKQVERVTSAEAVRRKKGLGRKFKETFISGSARTALEYMAMEVIIPSAKDMMAEAVQSGFEKLIYGDARPRRGSSIGGYTSLGRVNYQGMSTPTRHDAPPRSRSVVRRARQDFGEVVIQSRQEAEEVIDRMYDILSRYGTVTVANLNAMTGIPSGHTDNKWGWTALRGAKAVKLRDGGFVLELPDPEPLD